jgi:hypothetical protein
MRAAFFDEMKAMYQRLRSTGALSYEKVEKIKTLHLPASVTSLSVIGHPGMTVNIGPGIKTISATAFENTPDGMVINLPVAEGAVANAPWGATNAVIHYNTPYSRNVPIPN